MRIGLDLDGTVLSCAERQTALMCTVARQVGTNHFDSNEFWSLKRCGFNNLEALVQLNVPRKQAGVMAALWVANVEALQWLSFDRPFISPSELEHVLRRGHSLHLITARSNSVHLTQQLKKLGLLALLTSLDVVPPSNAVMQKAAALTRRACDVHIGDSEVDQSACLLERIEFRAVSSGMRSADFLYTQGVSNIWPEIGGCLEDLQ